LKSDQKIEVAIAPRNITVKADSQSKDDFSWHGAILKQTVYLPSRENSSLSNLRHNRLRCADFDKERPCRRRFAAASG
jgi:hypothetical protein